MPYIVRYSTRASIEYQEILEYVFKNFGVVVAAKVDAYFDEVIDSIPINPHLYPYWDITENIRRCVLSSQTTLYYRFTGEYVELIRFKGNPMGPQTIGL